MTCLQLDSYSGNLSSAGASGKVGGTRLERVSKGWLKADSEWGLVQNQGGPGYQLCHLETVSPPAAIQAFWMQPLLLEGGQAGSQEGFRFTSFFSSNFDSNLQARLTDLGRLSFSSISALLAGPPRRQAASAGSSRMPVCKWTLMCMYMERHSRQKMESQFFLTFGALASLINKPSVRKNLHQRSTRDHSVLQNTYALQQMTI